MKMISLPALFLTLVLASSSFAQAVPQVPVTRLINMAPAVITYNQSGIGEVQLNPDRGLLDVMAYRKVSILVGATKATSFRLSMGLPTLAQTFIRPISSNIQTIEINGPYLVLYLAGGAPNTTEKVALWVYLSS